jgi:protocatechuate 3,4-dioxygenase beta subunit
MHPIALLFVVASSVLALVGPDERGTRLHVTGTVCDRAGRPIPGAVLHIYQTDSTGQYTRDRPMDEPHARLSGRLTTNANGGFEIDTIRPGGYPKAVQLGGVARHIPAHIHIDVTSPNHPERRVQVVFSDDPLLSDPYWKKWVVTQRQPVITVKVGSGGMSAQLIITVE